MVAKSYALLEQIGDPFTSNNRQYIKVRMTNGNVKTVRWYSPKEYNKLYPNERIETTEDYDQKKIFGFDNGYITIFKGNTYEDREWFKMSSARYCRYWGWYFVSTEKLPEDIPTDVTPIKLSWEKVSSNNKLFPEEQIKKIIESVLYEPSPSQFFGNIGERYTFKLFVKKVTSIDGAYGQSNIHTMESEDKNEFVWATTAKSLEPNKWYTMTGTIKAHKVYQNSKQTWLTRCLSIKEINNE